MNTPEISVLIPVYRVEKYIEQCILSILNQTIKKNVEIIVVDDCSPDSSIEKLKQVLQNNPLKTNFSVTLIHHKTNRGQSAARNTALNAAKGTYTIFIDSDDYIDEKMLDKMCEKAYETNADIITVDLLKEYKDKTIVVNTPKDEDINKIRSSFIRGESIYLCNKLIRRSLYTENGIKFKEGYNISEDYAVMIPLSFHANKIEHVPHVFYHYIQYNETATTKRKYKQQEIDSLVYSTESLLSFIKKRKIADFKYDIMYRLLIIRYWCMIYTKGEHQCQYARLYPEINKHAFKLIKKTKDKQTKVLLYFVAKGYVRAFNFIRKLKSIVSL